jgi:hypothetical protein
LGSIKGEDLFKAFLIWGFSALAVLATIALILKNGGNPALMNVFQSIKDWFITG